MFGEPAAAEVRMRGNPSLYSEDGIPLLEVNDDMRTLPVSNIHLHAKRTRHCIQRGKDLGEIPHQPARRRVVGVEPDVDALHRQASGQRLWASSRNLYF